MLAKFEAAHIVVDADIARSAGGSEHPISKGARNLLLGIANTDVQIAFCPVLLAEWRKHRSVISARWLSSMIARKRFHLLTPEQRTQGEINSAQLPEKEHAIAEKDAHIVDIAFATGNFIASNDKVARSVFVEVASKSAIFDDLIWAIPTESSPAIVELCSKGGLIPSEWFVRES